MGMTYSVIVQCTDCVVFPSLITSAIVCYCDLQGGRKKVTAYVTFVSISSMSADFCIKLYTSVKNKNALVLI